MNYTTVPFSDKLIPRELYADGVMIANLNTGIVISNQINVVSKTDEEVRVNLYKDNNRLYLLFATKFSNVVVDAIEYYFSNNSFISLISNIDWVIGSSEWYYFSFDITNYINDNWVYTTQIFSSLSSAFSALTNSIEDKTIYVIVQYKTNDSNDEGGTSEIGGGDGDFNDNSDPITIPTPPILSAHNSGFVTLFRPSISQLQNLANYLWSNITDIPDNLAKIFQNPMDYFIAFNIVPCVPDVDTPRNIKIGLLTSNIEMPPVLSQWYSADLGTIQINKYWGSALDYSPYTKISLMLPFIGSVTLNTDEVMDSTLGITYHIDLLSGQCVALITVNNNVLYQFTGQCAVSIPMTSSDFSRIYTAAIGAVGTAITGGVSAANAGAAAGGATAALAGASAARAVNQTAATFLDTATTGKGVRGIQGIRQSLQQAADLAINAGNQAAASPGRVAGAIRASRISNTINNTVNQVMNAKAFIQHSGTISGSAGMLGVRVPYVIIEFPNQSLAENYKHFVGYPSNIYNTLQNCSGYTEVEKVYLSDIPATDSELEQIEDALKGGVYI